ncbi:MAG: endonuclease III domain-containing protein [Candidatus Micrarchaeia archaeon]
MSALLNAPSPKALMHLYSLSKERFGFLNWWPGDTQLEVIVGAVLTQQTSWNNVAKAIAALKSAKKLTLEDICSIKTEELENLIRPSGYYRQKAARLKGLCLHIKRNHSTLERFLSQKKDALREELLSINGIGRETADSIILYAAGKPIFVIDAYTKRILSRAFGMQEDVDYDYLQSMFHERISHSAKLYNDMHAQFVEIGKNYCTKSKPKCAACPLDKICRYASIAKHH